VDTYNLAYGGWDGAGMWALGIGIRKKIEEVQNNYFFRWMKVGKGCVKLELS
jgi:hypothetical protein